VTRHWPEYAIEGACLGVFMISACVFVTLLEHPLSPARAALADPTLRRVRVGVAMGLTAIGLIYSPWGQQSGAHMNPSLTFTYGSAVHAAQWTAVWVYFTAPPLGMPAAAEAYLRLPGAREVWCAKLHHDNDKRCIFRCQWRRTT